jgi:hypothetical protein
MTLMTDQELLIDLDDVEGHAGLRITDDSGWLNERLGRDPEARRVTLKAIDDDVEGHAAGTSVALRVFADDDDTEGHAISVHFPSREDADAFRRRLLMTGVLAGTIAIGAAGGIGLANLGSDQEATGAAAIGAASAPGMDWTQDERQDRAVSGAAATGTAAGMDWSQAERPGTATGGSQSTPDLESDTSGPAPR